MAGEPSHLPGMSPTALMTADLLLRVRIPDKRVGLGRGVLGLRSGRVTPKDGSRST